MTYDEGYSEGYEDAIKDVTADVGESPVGDPRTSAEILALAPNKEIWTGDLDEATDLWTAVAQEFPDAQWHAREYSNEVFVKNVAIPLSKADVYRRAAEGGIVEELFDVSYGADVAHHEGQDYTVFWVD